MNRTCSVENAELFGWHVRTYMYMYEQDEQVAKEGVADGVGRC